ncbi:CsbD family protein [Pantoea sp. Eser]|nr:CsbD family protein [Pantoea sp. Eser]
MSGKIEDKVKEAAGAVQEQWGAVIGSSEHQAKGVARRYTNQASYAARDAADCIKDQVQSSPFAGLAAAGVGVLTGFLLGRK